MRQDLSRIVIGNIMERDVANAAYYHSKKLVIEMEVGHENQEKASFSQMEIVDTFLSEW